MVVPQFWHDSTILVVLLLLFGILGDTCVAALVLEPFMDVSAGAEASPSVWLCVW